MSKKSFNNRDGFNLIEVLIAITLFAFLAVGVLTMTSMGIRTNSYAQHHTKAVQLAEDGLELLRRVEYSVAGLGSYNGLNQGYGTIPQYREYRREFVVNYGVDMSTLQVSVFWRVQGQDSLPIVLVTQRVPL